MKRLNSKEWTDGNGVVYTGSPKLGFKVKKKKAKTVVLDEPITLTAAAPKPDDAH
jgi:hypothetical protein